MHSSRCCLRCKVCNPGMANSEDETSSLLQRRVST
ncbi:hypothetical protein LINPERHAP1_LOCUS13410 [Linum perenne]